MQKAYCSSSSSDLLFKIIVLTTLVKYTDTRRECIKGMITPGYTIPQDDIIVEYGNALDIACILHDEYLTQHPNTSSEFLYFERGGQVVPKEMVHLSNSSSIHLHIEEPEISSWVYNCKLNGSGGVCLNTVYVGTKPVLRDDLNCLGTDYESLTCSWTAPVNPVPTSYTLRYFTNSRLLQSDCPHMEKSSNGQMSCTWTLKTQQPYRQTQDEMHFELTATNQLGTVRLNKTISNYKRVVPGLPENLTCTNVTSESVVLRWFTSNSMQMFPPGLQHRIIHRSEFDKNEWQVAPVVSISNRNKSKRITYNLANLTYAFAQYEIGVAMRSAVADPNDETMWSKYTYTTCKTKSKVPGRPPTTTTGSFESVSVGNAQQRIRDVYVYWQHVPDKIKNGKNFEYVIEVEPNSTMKPVDITDAYAKFANLSVDEEYVFKIWSANHVGRSDNFSTVVVPKQSDSVAGPTHFTKLIRDDHAYELAWDSPSFSVQNYTIFACMYERDRPYQCAGQLNWKIIPPDKIAYTVKPPEPKKIYQFAISANTESSTSGMVWAECTVMPSHIGNKLRNVWISRINAMSIVLNWKLDCSERIGGIQGFVVRYCNHHSYVTGCEWLEMHIEGSNVEQANITGLLPFTKYVFCVTKLTRKGEYRQTSDHVYGTTLEAAPTPPTHLTEIGVTNSSITICWKKPKAANGKLRHYIIIRNSYIAKIEANTEEFTLDHLSSFMTYNISIIACTVACSEPSHTLTTNTLGGYPSKIGQPGVTFQNDSFTLVEWERPRHPNGNCDVYEILFKEKRRYENRTLNIRNTTERSHVIEDCGNGGKYNAFFISVRAVNILNGSRYEGPWSDELQSFCRHATTNSWVWALGPTLLLVAFLSYLGRRMYYNYKRMRDIEVKLPPGLATFAGSFEKPNQMHVVEEVPLRDNLAENKAQELENCKHYMPMGISRKSSTNVARTIYAIPVNENLPGHIQEYVEMCNPNRQMGGSNQIGYVQVADIPSFPMNNSPVLLSLNNVPHTTGYVTVCDTSSTQTSP